MNPPTTAHTAGRRINSQPRAALKGHGFTQDGTGVPHTCTLHSLGALAEDTGQPEHFADSSLKPFFQRCSGGLEPAQNWPMGRNRMDSLPQAQDRLTPPPKSLHWHAQPVLPTACKIVPTTPLNGLLTLHAYSPATHSLAEIWENYYSVPLLLGTSLHCQRSVSAPPPPCQTLPFTMMGILCPTHRP